LVAGALLHYGRTMDDEMDDRDPFADPERLRTWILNGDAGWPNPPPVEDELEPSCFDDWIRWVCPDRAGVW